MAPQEYKHTESLYSHIAAVHEGKKRSKNYVCDLCGTACVNRSKLKVHVEAVHERKKPYQCDFCQKAFARKPCLKKHMKKCNISAGMPGMAEMPENADMPEMAEVPEMADMPETQEKYF